MKKIVALLLLSFSVQADISMHLYTQYGFYDSSNNPDQLILNTGEAAWIEIIDAGPDGVAGYPEGFGIASGDDTILHTFIITASSNPATDYSGYAYISGMHLNFEGLQGASIFVRIILQDGYYYNGHIQLFPDVNLDEFPAPSTTSYNFGGHTGANKNGDFSMFLGFNSTSDFDGDGLTDGDELNTYSTDPNDADSDDDGLSDGYEINTSLTDANDADSDDDGLSDGYEINTSLTHPLDPDSDDDGLTDGDELNTYSTDPNDADSDDDGLSDGDEVTNGTSPLIVNIKPVLNIESFYECQNGATVSVSATPTSGYPTNFTYQWVHNGYAVPSLYGGTGSSYSISGSSAANGNYSVIVSNDTGSTTNNFVFEVYVDSDGDNLSDGRETYITSTNPADVDSDYDGLTDGDEVNTYSTDPNDADSDDDGFNDGDEVSGLDPTTPNTDIFNSVESKMKDLRIGSQTFGVSNGNAKIRMYVDESGNLTDWTNTPHVLELDIPADTDTKFFRFRMD